MKYLTRRELLKCALAIPAAAWLTNFRALAAPVSKMVKITGIKTMGLDNVGDGCLIRIETDAGIVGHCEAGLPSAAARQRIAMMLLSSSGRTRSQSNGTSISWPPRSTHSWPISQP